MQQIPFLLTEWQELNSLLYAPLNATKRVQYTCLAVSTHYIVLGATSGSIYLFTREPCIFQQLIPLLEGAVYRAQISPDEKTIALATVRGSISLISLKPSIKLLTVSSEHLGERVNCLCWNDSSSEVYAGDETGKLSVTVLSTFMTNGIFQSPSYTLMNLDSKIVQLNCSSTLLLVSTLNRCYICDTVLEQYKQIGNKPRDGEFGACFLKAHSANGQASVESGKQERTSNVKQVFSVSKQVPPNESQDQDCLPKMYCARPGSRIWEVTANGIVVKTHQFKEALAIPPLPVYKPYIGKLLRLKNQHQTWPVQSINFAQLFVILQKYLISYTSNGLYIIDPEKGEVLMWNDEFPDIIMAHIISDKIYLMTSSGVFHSLTLVSVDSLIIKLYDKKSYKECWELCQILRPQLVNSVPEESCDIDIKQNANVSEILVPVISLIKSNYNYCPMRMKSGIVIVNTADRDLKNDLIPFADAKSQVRQDLRESEDSVISLNTNGTARSPVTGEKSKNGNVDAKNGLGRNAFNQKAVQCPRTESDDITSLQSTIGNVQTDLESLYSLISSQMKPDISEGHLEGLIEQFFEILDQVKRKYEVSSALQNYLFEVVRSAELHYCNTLLENTPVDLVRNAKNEKLLKLLVKIFVNINASKYLECPCDFPHAIFDPNKSCEAKFMNIGREILSNLSASEFGEELCVRVCNQIPSMWREYLPMKGYPKKTIPNNLLKQCLQSRDSVVMAMILPALDEQQWKFSAHVLDSVRNGRCSNCGKAYDAEQTGSREFTIDWPAIINLIIKKQGASSAMTFLRKVHENLPQVNFDRSLYQSIIFSTILSHHGVKHAIELDSSHAEHNSICSPEIMRQVVQSVEKDVDGTLNKDALGNGPHHWGMRYNLATSTCPCCTLSLQTPVLLGNNGIALFPCGHAYHVNCMIQKKISRCNLHT